MPNNYLAWVELANVLALLDRVDEARDAVERAKGIVPSLTLALFEKGTRIVWRDREDLVEPQLAGLRKLGIE